jgi:hypothetical protein
LLLQAMPKTLEHFTVGRYYTTNDDGLVAKYDVDVISVLEIVRDARRVPDSDEIEVADVVAERG